MMCLRRCKHGGLCTLPKDHPGDHDTGFCRFSDAEALPDAAGDALYLAKMNPRLSAARYN